MIASPKFRKSRLNFWPWLLAGAAVVGGSFLFDHRVDAALDVLAQPALKNFAWWISKSAEGEVVVGAGIVLAAFYFFLNRPRVAAHIFFVAGASLLTGLAGTILRVLMGRTRPGIHGPEGVAPGFYGVWHDGHFILGQAAFSAFPSGHAALAVGLAAAAWLVHRGWGAVVALWALAVMWSRVALEWHHLSDVLASALVSIPLAWLLKNVLLTSVEFQFDNFYRAWKKK